MSRHFGAIRQLGYVVPDIEAAMDYWSRTLGVGPWFYNPRVPIVGVPSLPFDVSDLDALSALADQLTGAAG